MGLKSVTNLASVTLRIKAMKEAVGNQKGGWIVYRLVFLLYKILVVKNLDSIVDEINQHQYEHKTILTQFR